MSEHGEMRHLGGNRWRWEPAYNVVRYLLDTGEVVDVEQPHGVGWVCVEVRKLNGASKIVGQVLVDEDGQQTLFAGGAA